MMPTAESNGTYMIRGEAWVAFVLFLDGEWKVFANQLNQAAFVEPTLEGAREWAKMVAERPVRTR